MIDQLTKTETKRAAKSRTARPKAPSKKTHLIKLLSRRSGAYAVTISAKLGLQLHTTRAVFSGLRKAGFDITKESAGAGKPSRYRIVSAPKAPAAEEATDGK